MPDFPSRRDVTSLVVHAFALLIVPGLGRAQYVLALWAVIVVGALGCLDGLVFQTFALLVVPRIGRAQDVMAWGAEVIVGAL